MSRPGDRDLRVDLHVHLGEGPDGRPVKIGASRRLSLDALGPAARIRGVDVLGLVDAQVASVRAALRQRVDDGRLVPLPGGNLRDRHTGVVLVLGAEVEISDATGRYHLLLYVPDLDALDALGRMLERSQTSPHLSTQVTRVAAAELSARVHALGGMVVIAHAFTPHRGLVGVGGSPAALAPERPDAVEMGLSADDAMSHWIDSLDGMARLASSDAHGPATIGREVTRLRLPDPGFASLAAAVSGEAVLGFTGLMPALGKYHRTACRQCGHRVRSGPATLACPRCGSDRVVAGVWDLLACRGEVGRTAARTVPYGYSVISAFVRGLGPAAERRLLERFGDLYTAYQESDADALESVVGPRIARDVVALRTGTARIEAGGGGVYGRLLADPGVPRPSPQALSPVRM